MADERRTIFRSAALHMGIAQSVAAFALVVGALTVVPKFEKFFGDFGTKLPNATRVILDVSHFLRSYWYLAILPVLVWPFANLVIVRLLTRRPEIVVPRRLWYTTVWAILYLMVLFAVFALFRPLIVLITPFSPAPGSPATPPASSGVPPAG